MEINVSVAEFSRVLSLMQGVVQKKNTMPILANILLECREGKLTVAATDLDVGLKTSIPCHAVAEGAITVSARALCDIVRMLPGPDVRLKKLANNYLSVESNKTNAKLLALSASDYPKLPSVEGLELATVNVDNFVDAVQKTVYSTSTDENRHTLTGIFFSPESNGTFWSLVSTDGHRLSRVRKPASDLDLKIANPVIMPRKGLLENLRIFQNAASEDDNQTFDIGFLPNHAVVRCGETVLSMRLIDGAFPDYHQIVPRLADKIIRASRQDLLMSVKRVSVLTHDKASSIKMHAKSGQVIVSCTNPETGEVSDGLMVQYSGPEIELGLNPKYLLDALSSLEGETVTLKATDPLSPLLIVGTHAEEHECVIMPMRLQN